MTVATKNAKVYLNDKHVGHILNNKGGNKDEWQTQIIQLVGGDLINGDNTLELRAVEFSGGGDNNFDDYFVRNMICHYHQDV
jgi:hypothetical protein